MDQILLTHGRTKNHRPQSGFELITSSSPKITRPVLPSSLAYFLLVDVHYTCYNDAVPKLLSKIKRETVTLEIFFYRV